MAAKPSNLDELLDAAVLAMRSEPMERAPQQFVSRFTATARFAARPRWRLGVAFAVTAMAGVVFFGAMNTPAMAFQRVVRALNNNIHRTERSYVVGPDGRKTLEYEATILNPSHWRLRLTDGPEIERYGNEQKTYNPEKGYIRLDHLSRADTPSRFADRTLAELIPLSSHDKIERREEQDAQGRKLDRFDIVTRGMPPERVATIWADPTSHQPVAQETSLGEGRKIRRVEWSYGLNVGSHVHIQAPPGTPTYDVTDQQETFLQRLGPDRQLGFTAMISHAGQSVRIHSAYADHWGRLAIVYSGGASMPADSTAIRFEGLPTPEPTKASFATVTIEAHRPFHAVQNWFGTPAYVEVLRFPHRFEPGQKLVLWFPLMVSGKQPGDRKVLQYVKLPVAPYVLWDLEEFFTPNFVREEKPNALFTDGSSKR